MQLALKLYDSELALTLTTPIGTIPKDQEWLVIPLKMERLPTSIVHAIKVRKSTESKEAGRKLHLELKLPEKKKQRN